MARIRNGQASIASSDSREMPSSQPPAYPAAADRHAERERDRHRDDSGEKRGRAAPDDARETSRRSRRCRRDKRGRRLRTALQLVSSGSCGRDVGREDRDQHEEEDDGEAGHRAAPAHETPQRRGAPASFLREPFLEMTRHALSPQPRVDEKSRRDRRAVEEYVGGRE